MKAYLILTGIAVIFIGLFLSFGILVYSTKENDSSGFYGFFISFGFIALGIFQFFRARKITRK